MRLLSEWVEGLVILSDCDEACDKVILDRFFFNLLDEGQIVVVDHDIVLILDKEVIESADDVDNLVFFGLVQTFGRCLQVRHLSEADLALFIIGKDASSVGVAKLFLDEAYHED